MQNQRRFKIQLFFGLGMLMLAAITSTQYGEAESTDKISINYEGQLQDEKRKPIAGVYPLEFRLYRNESKGAPLWKESHWIAVVDGKYQVTLGEEQKIRPSLRKNKQLYLSVHLKDIGELTREPISLGGDPKPEAPKAPLVAEKATKDAVGAPPAKPGTPNKTGTPGKPSYKTESSFAEVADFARKAGEAENAEKLGGKTLEALEAEIEQLRTKLAEYRVEGKEAPSVGDDTQLLPRIGGTGGRAYTRECPPGHVVTGIRGSAGALVDSIQMICSPLK